VVLTQSNTQQMLSTLQKDYGFCSDDKFLFSNSICFDLSVAQIFSALTSGGVVCAAASEIRKDPLQLAQFMQRVGITFTYFTPTQFALLLDRAADALRNCDKYRTAFFAGERLPVRMVKAFYDLGTSATIYNTWSPCELVVQTSIHKVEYPHTDNLNIPIGYPLANCRHYIVDSRRQPLPAGLVGEICVGGAQVGAGYLNRPQANAKSFLEDPYCSPDDRARNWTRMFRTGDTGRFRADGQLEFHGRIAGDKQIKLRGFRIDLGEVEHQIYLRAASDNGPKLVDLSVVARSTQNESPEFTDDRQLIAYLVPQESLDLVQKRTFVTELHKKLAQQLNSYMLPNGYQFLTNLPVTIGGKVDRQNLLNRDLDLLYPAMGSAEDGKESSVIRDADANTLKAITQIFKEVLKLPESHEVEASDNFFELGGQSIVVLRLQAKLKRTFKTSVSLSELFKAPTPVGVFRALTDKLQEVGLEGAKIEDKKLKWADEIRLPNESRYMVKFGTWRQSGSDISDILLVGVSSAAPAFS
jgi:aryl carrier-like protein